MADPGDLFQGANVKSSLAGITLGQEVIRNLSIATGVYYQPNMDGINIKTATVLCRVVPTAINRLLANEKESIYGHLL